MEPEVGSAGVVSKAEPKVKPGAELLGVGAGIGIKNLESTKIFCRPNLLKGCLANCI